MKALTVSIWHWFVRRVVPLRAAVTTETFWAEFAVFLCILLFGYTAANKLADVQKFAVQMAKSPMLTAWAPYLAWGVPVTELVIALLLIIPRTRLAGLFGFFFVMALFTAYIAVIQTYSDEIPCSCGGVLEKMGWAEHLAFNIIYMLFAAAAILVSHRTGHIRTVRLITRLMACIIMAIGSVSILYLWYEAPNYRPNGFLRFIPATLLTPVKTFDLPDEYHYFAGIQGGMVYLGHHAKKLQLIEVDLTSGDTAIRRLDIKGAGAYRFRDMQLTVRPPYFYLTDGTIPRSFRGLLKTGVASAFMPNRSYFIKQFPVSTTRFVNRLLLDSAHGQVLAVETSTGMLDIRKDLLQKQLDGQFCVEGSLSYDGSTELITYVYRYRNSFLTMDTNLNLVARHRTIDTNTTVKFRVATIESSNQYTLSSPPSAVNHGSSSDNGMLYIHSKLRGDNEDRTDFRRISAIDVYDLTNGGYRYSFYIPIPKINGFIVRDDGLFVLGKEKLFVYHLKKPIIGRFSSNGNRKTD